jgi:two-component system chemotaxis sensor kinase CheA
VDIKKLDHLMNVVGELAVVRTGIARMSDKVSRMIGRSDLTIELDQLNRGLDRRLSALREGILEVRMVPLNQMFDRLARMVRKISMELGKEIHFVMSGADTEVDKLITEELSDPLMHLIRNAIDHGVEQPAVRTDAGKPEYGTVALTAYQKGSHVVIEVEDDGAGIDDVKLLRTAVKRGFVSAEQAEVMTPREIMNLIFIPGLSTSDKTTEISGRGVGMDIVKTNISALGGVVEVQSELRIGTKMTITLPITLATIPALLVAVHADTYAIPLNTVTEAVLVSKRDIEKMLGNETVLIRNETLVLCRLGEFFGVKDPAPDKEDLCVVVVSLGRQRLGLVVDLLFSQQDVVIKPLGAGLRDMTCFSGATDVGEERLALVIDTSHVIDRFFAEQEGADLRAQLLVHR